MLRPLLVLLLAGLLWPAAAHAGSLADFGIRVESGGPPLPVAAPIALPPEALADSTPATGSRGILKALLIAPTDRYGHGVLGDAVEAGGLRVITDGGLQLEYRLSADDVFEDLTPRLVDLTGDGRDEVLLVKSHRERGAALALFEATEGALVLIGETPALGTENRWRNPSSAGDFDGDGRQEVVEVETPHIGGTLRLWRWQDGRLEAGAEFAGVSNHAAGSRALGLSAALDLDGDGDDELLVPDRARRALLLLDLRDGAWVERARLPHKAPIAGDFLVGDLDGTGLPDVGYTLADGTVVRLLR